MSRRREPQARAFHAAAGVGQTMLVWGGEGAETCSVERFDVFSAIWQELRQLQGQSLPDGLENTAFASDGERAYVFGGFASGTRYNKLYAIDLTSLVCTELASSGPSPSARSSSCMVCVGRRLVVCGGYTDAEDAPNVVQVFDLATNTWTIQATTGEEPVALHGHTLTMIDQHRAVLFGGWDGSLNHNDAYVLDVETWRWCKLRTSGEKPPARQYHAACCITDPSTRDHPLLMVVGGYNGERTVFSDMWLMDVTDGLWTRVTVPTPITQRFGHSAVVFGTGPDFRVVVLFGGERESWGSHAQTSKCTLILLSQRRGLWAVDRVVSSEELIAPNDELREQIRRLHICPSTVDERVRELERMLSEERVRCLEAEERVRAEEQRRHDVEQRVHVIEEAKQEAERLAEERVRDLERRVREAVQGKREAEERMMEAESAKQKVEQRHSDLEGRLVVSERRQHEAEQRQQEAEERDREALSRSQTAERRLAAETRRRIEAEQLNQQWEEGVREVEALFAT